MSSNTLNEDAQFYSELLRAFLDSANDAIFVLCDEMKLLLCNKKTQQWLGRTEEDLTEHQKRIPITDLLGNTGAVDFFEASFKRALESEEVIFETQIKPLNGKQRWIELNMQRVDIEAGDMVIVVARDITDRKNAEEEKERLQRELHQSQKMDVLGQLTGGIAHDFNNILGIITGYSELAIDQYKTKNKSIPVKYIEYVLTASERAKKLISQLMVFSRNDNDESMPLQLAPLIEEDLKMLRATMPSSIEFEVSYGDKIPYVLMDPVKLHQLLLNICINAKDAMDGAGKITVSLGLNREMNDECSSCYRQVQGEWVEITIMDTGSGIEPDVINRVFDPFFTTKTVGKGTGMGLAVVGKIVESYKGHIIVKSELGKGTGIHLLFPAVYESSKKELQNKAAPITEEFNSDGKSLLIVDDEADLAGFMAEMLTMHGYKCISETSSIEALKLYENAPDAFDLIITDQTMPGLTGCDMIVKIREIKPDQAVIMVTGYSETMDSSLVRKLDIDFLQKPVDTNKLLQIMHKKLN